MKKVLFNAKVYVEKGNYAQAVLVEDGMITAVGTDEEILALAGTEAESMDCGGKTLIPGFNDSHLHFMQMSEVKNQAQIEGCRSIGDMVEICRAFMQEHPERVKDGLHAAGWNQDLFTDGGRMPDRHDLDRISTEIPIVLERVCGHIVSANTKLIDMLGLTADSPEIPDGSFLIGEDGRPNGIFTGNACNIAKDVIPDFTMEERREMLKQSMEYAVSMGLTSVQSNDVGTTFMDGPAAFAMFHDIYDRGEGLLRYRHQVCFNSMEEFRKYLSEGEFAKEKEKENEKQKQKQAGDSGAASGADSWLTLGPLKLFKDGSLGARTALLSHGYQNDGENHGLEWIKQEEMEEYCKLAGKHGLQVVTHAIGDAAVSKTIDAYEKAFTDGRNALRHGVVHCQITDQALLERIAREDILVMAQPVFLDYDMHIVEDLCGKDLASTSYAFGTLQKMGVHVSYGTDCPVEDCNPFDNIYMAVTRKDRQGQPEGGFYPKECADVETAIDAYTYESAYAEFMEDRKGRIKPGYYADMVLLDQDIFAVPADEIRNIRPVLTMVGGRVVYSKA